MDYGYKKVSDIVAKNEGGNYGRFGINDATLVAFDYNPKGGSSPDVPQDALDIKFKVGDKEYMWRIFPPKTFSTEPTNSEAYIKSQKEAEDQFILAVSQLTEAFVPSNVIEQTMVANRPNSFQSYVELMGRLIKNVPNWNQKELDLFLQWQGKPGANQTRTYLEVPKVYNLKYGNEIYVTAKELGNFTRDTTEKGLVYKNVTGAKHPISRTEYWINNSANAKKIDLSTPEQNSAQDSFAPEAGNVSAPSREENW